MNCRIHVGLWVVAIAIVMVACNRHVVIEPEMVGSRNQSDWIVNSEPKPTPPPQPKVSGSDTPNAAQAPAPP